jgi:asparagine synthetase A
MMKTIRINLVLQQDEEESVFLQKAVKAALQAFRKTHNEATQKYDHDAIIPSQPTEPIAIPGSICERRESSASEG